MRDLHSVLVPSPCWFTFFAPHGAAWADVCETVARALETRNQSAVCGGVVTRGRHLDPRSGAAIPSGLVDPDIFGVAGDLPGIIVLPQPLVHPAFRKELARRSGLTEDEIRAVARFDTCLEAGQVVNRDRIARSEIDPDVLFENGGAKAIRALLERLGLSDDGIVDQVVVIPPLQRPLVQTDAGVLLPGPIGAAYADVLDALDHFSCVQPSMLSSLQMEAWEGVQDAFDRLCETAAGTAKAESISIDQRWLSDAARMWSESTSGIVGSPDQVLDSLRSALCPSLPPAPLVGADGSVDPLTPVGCFFIDDHALLIQLPYAILRFDLPAGTPRWIVRSTMASVMQVLPRSYSSIPHALVVLRCDVLPSVHLLNLDSGQWVSGWNGVSPPAFPMAPYKSNQWSIYDYGMRTARTFSQVGNWKSGALLSPCLKYTWIEDSLAIVRLSDGSAQLELDMLPSPEQRPQGAGEHEEEASEEDLDEILDRRLAFVARPDGFRVFHRGILSDRAQRLAEFSDSYVCAGFDGNGSRLAIGKPTEVVVYDIGEDRKLQLHQTISLAPLAEQLTLRGRFAQTAGLTLDIESSLLNGFGTVAGIRLASFTEFCQAVQRYCFDEVAPEVLVELFSVLSQPT